MWFKKVEITVVEAVDLTIRELAFRRLPENKFIMLKHLINNEILIRDMEQKQKQLDLDNSTVVNYDEASSTVDPLILAIRDKKEEW